jgi:tRNA A37 threonylcarbamoyladenosine dehydratase
MAAFVDGEPTVGEALQREVVPEIAAITALGPRVVKRRLEKHHGKSLVQNVFSEEWLLDDDEEDGKATDDADSHREDAEAAARHAATRPRRRL